MVSRPWGGPGSRPWPGNIQAFDPMMAQTPGTSPAQPAPSNTPQDFWDSYAVVVFDQAVRVDAVIPTDLLTDMRQIENWAIYFNSTMDQPATFELVGHISNNPQGALPLGTSQAIGQNAQILIPGDPDIWTPYMGWRFSTSGGTAPTSGRVSVTMIVRRRIR